MYGAFPALIPWLQAAAYPRFSRLKSPVTQGKLRMKATLPSVLPLSTTQRW